MKAIVLVFTILVLAGCSENVPEMEDGHVISSIGEAGTLFRVRFEGHRYICREKAGQACGICHDPDCPCGKTR